MRLASGLLARDRLEIGLLMGGRSMDGLLDGAEARQRVNYYR